MPTCNPAKLSVGMWNHDPVVIGFVVIYKRRTVVAAGKFTIERFVIFSLTSHLTFVRLNLQSASESVFAADDRTESEITAAMMRKIVGCRPAAILNVCTAWLLEPV